MLWVRYANQTYSNIFIGDFENKYIHLFLQGILLIILPFINDIFFIWTWTKKQLTIHLNVSSKKQNSNFKYIISQTFIKSKFSKVKIWPIPRKENSANTKSLNLELLTHLTCIIFLSSLEKWFEATEIYQKFKREGDWAKLRQSICLLRQSWTKYLAQSKVMQ